MSSHLMAATTHVLPPPLSILLALLRASIADQLRSKIIVEHPIRNSLNAFRGSYRSIYNRKSIAFSINAFDQLDHEGRVVAPYGATFYDLSSDDFDLDRIKPLRKVDLADDSDDSCIWDRVYDAVTESTPPPRPVASSV
ncbi:hypothetical protein MYCTH_2129170 [Thermothelomyces thermophilus ATCC 42464]|uniref:Uncharacterized protein n=1 Tax=Thermothelomyces thermophilus (strain ATCC 42464 / BCRC 31852 / DSM 1799) TaxID=573729 RepID=G2QKH0_THET4|nr:uncharacterized protein MYCTH_2129170 [Thermothelomyces thermophilus ATCC 42464]AEO60076.1 hypothetical protein MYCTH_2129170 [Thermothelomyces thermophilus ATCC 42464]